MTHLGLRPVIIAGAMLIFAGAMMLAATTTTSASGLYWVVGNLITNSCDIVSRDPVVSPEGPLWFGNGPHKSYDEAKLARQGISACPRTN